MEIPKLPASGPLVRTLGDTDSARELGRAAGMRGQVPSDNPYRWGPPRMRQAWEDGWTVGAYEAAPKRGRARD